MVEPVSAATVFAFINSTFRLAEYAVKLYGVESENGVFVRLIQRVRLDLEETERLLSVPAVKAKFISTPEKLPWIKGTIVSTKVALNEIGRWVERVRAEKEGSGSVSFQARVRYIFSDQDKLASRSAELRTCHQTLSTVLTYLIPLEQTATVGAVEPPKYGDVTYFDDILPLSPAQKREKRERTESMSDQGISPKSQRGIHSPRTPSSMSSFAESPALSSYFPNTINPAQLTVNSDSQSGPSNSCKVIATGRPYVRSSYTASDSPLTNHLSDLSIQQPLAESPFAPMSSDNYFSRQEAPQRPPLARRKPLPAPALPYGNTWPGYPPEVSPLAEATKPSDSVDLQENSLTYPLEPFYPLLSPPTQSSDNPSLSEMDKMWMDFSNHPFEITERDEPIMKSTVLKSNAPKIPGNVRKVISDQTTPKIVPPSARNPQGPVDPYEIWDEPTASYSTATSEKEVEMMGDLLVPSPTNSSTSSLPQKPQPNVVSPNISPRHQTYNHSSDISAKMTPQDFSLLGIAPGGSTKLLQQPLEFGKAACDNKSSFWSEKLPLITESQVSPEVPFSNEYFDIGLESTYGYQPMKPDFSCPPLIRPQKERREPYPSRVSSRRPPSKSRKGYVSPYREVKTPPVFPRPPKSAGVYFGFEYIDSSNIPPYPDLPTQEEPPYPYDISPLTSPTYLDPQWQQQQHPTSTLTKPPTPEHASAFVAPSRPETLSEQRRRNQRAFLALSSQGL